MKPVIKKVMDELRGVLTTPPVDSSKLLQLLEALEKVDMTLSILLEASVGKLVNEQVLWFAFVLDGPVGCGVHVVCSKLAFSFACIFAERRLRGMLLLRQKCAKKRLRLSHYGAHSHRQV